MGWDKIRFGLRRLSYARFVALVVIAFAIVMYAAPYLLDAVQCTSQSLQPIGRCVVDVYDGARSDTNLAAGIIALAVTLAAWRPVPESAD